MADEWAYFKRKGIIDDIFLASFIHHPLDLSNSWIEKERVIKYGDSEVEDEVSFFRKLSFSLRINIQSKLKESDNNDLENPQLYSCFN